MPIEFVLLGTPYKILWIAGVILGSEGPMAMIPSPWEPPMERHFGYLVPNLDRKGKIEPMKLVFHLKSVADYK